MGWFKKEKKEIYRDCFDLYITMGTDYADKRFYSLKKAEKERVRIIKAVNKGKVFKFIDESFNHTFYINPINVTKVYILKEKELVENGKES